MKRILLTIAALTVSLSPALAAEPIVGSWKRSTGTIIEYKNCGGDDYCGTVLNSEYKGKSIGKMTGKDGS
jgi:uncharacterized protein (DUF2147 family)